MADAETKHDDGQADASSGSGSAPVQYLTLSPDSEPMKLESLCVNCEKNVRGDEPSGCLN